MNIVNPRKLAINILVDIEENKAFSNISLNKHIDTEKVSMLDRRLITQLVYGVLENKLYLDYIIKDFSKTKFDKINIYILNILRLGIYQILFLDRIPDSAAVNESVKLTKKVNYRLSGFVNGILRNITRTKKDIDLSKLMSKPTEYLSIKYSHPKWLVEKWINDFGEEFTEDLLKSNNSVPSLSIRTNTLKINREDLLRVLEDENVICSMGNYAPEAIIIKSSDKDLNNIDSFSNGLFQVQDESSMIVGHALNPKPNDFIIDICSAPGGKSTHLAQLMRNKGKILSRDIHSHKLNLIKENANRLGINIINLEQYDALELDQDLIGTADKVLVDAPCSGFGIIRRKPEIRYFKEKKDINNLQEIQTQILTNSSKYLKKNGELVYSTCTIQNEENINVIDNFLENNSDFIMLDIKDSLPFAMDNEEKHLQLYPHINKTDGFFICKLKRIR